MNSLIVPTSTWDLETMLENSEGLAGNIGALLIGLIGTVAIIIAVIFFFTKLLSENSRRSWVTIIILFVGGGLALAGGLTMFADIAEGAKTTIDQLGT